MYSIAALYFKATRFKSQFRDQLSLYTLLSFSFLDSLDNTLEQFNIIEEQEKNEQDYRHKANLLR
jgi:hypothetical protein